MSEMQVSIEEIEYCKSRVNYTADSSVVSSKTKEAINELKKLPVPGFRPGKATDLAVKVRFKDRIKQWVQNEMLNVANSDVLFETKIEPWGQPQVEKSSLANNDFSCQMVYLTKPSFELKEYKGLEIPSPQIGKSANDIAEQLIQQLRLQSGESVPYGENDFVQIGDRITLDYSVGDKNETGKLYVVGEKLFPEFDEGLFGMSPGEEREFNIDLNGKKEVCKVLLHMGMKQVPHPLDDELAKNLGVSSLQELNKIILSNSESQYKRVKDELVGNQIKLRLIASHDFEPPPWITNMEAQYLSIQEGWTLEQWPTIEEEVKAKYLERGKDNVKFTLILDAINKKEPETVLSDIEVMSVIRNSLKQRGASNIDVLIQNAAKNGSLQGLIAKTRNDHTLQWLVNNTKVVE